MNYGNNPVPDRHMEVLYRVTQDTYGKITAAGLTQDNRSGNNQKALNSRLNTATAKGILAGSVVAVAGDNLIGPCAGDYTDSSTDKAVGIAVNDAVGNPFESSSAVGSGKVVYLHGTGSVFRTDIYETLKTDGSTPTAYTAGDKVYASRNGLLINRDGLDNTAQIGNAVTEVGIILESPSSANSYYMTIQMRI